MSIDFIRKECHPPLSLSLYLRIHLSLIPSPMFAPLHLRHIVVLFIHFWFNIINPKMLSLQWHSAGGNNQPLTNTFSFMNIDSVCFISNPIDRFDDYKNNTNSTIPSSIDGRDDLFYRIVCFPLLVITATLLDCSFPVFFLIFAIVDSW